MAVSQVSPNIEVSPVTFLPHYNVFLQLHLLQVFLMSMQEDQPPDIYPAQLFFLKEPLWHQDVRMLLQVQDL